MFEDDVCHNNCIAQIAQYNNLNNVSLEAKSLELLKEEIFIYSITPRHHLLRWCYGVGKIKRSVEREKQKKTRAKMMPKWVAVAKYQMAIEIYCWMWQKITIRIFFIHLIEKVATYKHTHTYIYALTRSILPFLSHWSQYIGFTMHHHKYTYIYIST